MNISNNNLLLEVPHINDIPMLNKNYLSKIPYTGHAPRILLLYGSLRKKSYSRLVTEEAARILNYLGAEIKIFNPSTLPLPDDTTDINHPAVKKLRSLAIWSEGQVWCSPERHGNISSIMKAQIDHLPLNIDGIRTTQGKTLAVMQVCGGSQSFNTVNALRILGRWMRMLTIPNQSSVAKVYNEFNAAGRMIESPYYSRIIDVMEELVKTTILVRKNTQNLTDRYSERCAQIKEQIIVANT